METEIIVAVYMCGEEVLSYQVCDNEEDFQARAKLAQERSGGTIELKKIKE
jgi:hypothetical protein